MRQDLVRIEPITSSFLSCEKDTEAILRKLFIDSRPYSDILKRLLVIQNSDCLDNNCVEYQNRIKEMTLPKLIDEGYILLSPKMKEKEFAEQKSNIVIWFDGFVPNDTNPEYRDCLIYIEILCPTDAEYLTNYRSRPIKIAGYIDGILNQTRLSGIGKLLFGGLAAGRYTENKVSWVLVYHATHGSDDQIPPEESI